MLVLTFILFLSNLINYGHGKIEPFIIRGNYAKISMFPYSAFLGIQCDILEDDPIPWICGSSIVNQNILLTAGHCLHSCKENTYITVSVGHERIMQGAVASARSFVVHERYDDEHVFNDIAVVKTRRPLVFNLNVSRLALMNSPPYQEKAFVAGWGLDDTNDHSDKLKYTEQYVWKEERCMKLLQHMPKGTLCAYSNKGYADEGDSGSALVVRGYIQLGLVSYKNPGISKSVIVYTDTGYHYDWIIKAAIKLMCKH